MQRRCFLTRLGSLVALLSAPGLPACSLSEPVAVGIHPWVGYETLFLARDLGWLPAAVRLAEGGAASDSFAALAAGEVQAACLTLDEVLRARAAGVPLSVALVFNVSAGADVVLARPAIADLADLAGKRIGVELGALGALFFQKLMDAAALPPSACKVVDLPADRQVEAWRRGEVDALITYEPVATRIRHEGGRRLFDSRQIPDTIFDLLAVRSDLSFGRDTVLKALVASHFLGLEHLRSNRQDAVYRMARHLDVLPEEVERAVGGVAFPSLAANRGYLDGKTGRLAVAAKGLSSLMTRQGLLPREDSLENLLATRWLPPVDG